MRYRLQFSLRIFLIAAIIVAGIGAFSSSKYYNQIGIEQHINSLGSECSFAWMGTCRVRRAPVQIMNPGRSWSKYDLPKIKYVPTVYHVHPPGDQPVPKTRPAWLPFCSQYNWSINCVSLPIDSLNDSMTKRLKNLPSLEYLVVTNVQTAWQNGAVVARNESDELRLRQLEEILPNVIVLNELLYESNKEIDR